MTENQTIPLIKENIPLAPLTTLKVGGAARFFAEATSESEIIEAIDWAENRNLPLLILGGGSNLVVPDEGFDGLVLKISTKGIEKYSERDYVNLTVQAGENWDDFVAYCVNSKLPGLECLSGIPGSVGASPVQNIGAYGQEVSQTISEVKCYDLHEKKIIYLYNGKNEKNDLSFAYRQSVFNTTEKNRYVILAVVFSFFHQSKPQLLYKDLQQYFGDKKPDLTEMREAVLQIRRSKSMVIDENDPNSKSVGSFFKNPIVSKETFNEITEKMKSEGIETVPFFAIDENQVKIPAAWLIEQSGFRKGFRFGNVGISTKHSLAIINAGNAAAKDIFEFAEKIQKTVKEKFEIELKPEPVFIKSF